MALRRTRQNESEAGKRIEFLVLKILEAMKTNTPYEPTDEFLNPLKKRRVAYFNDESARSHRSTVQIKPFTDQTGALLVVSLTSLQVIREQRSVSKRALFYLYPGLFKSQSLVDHAVDQLAFLMSTDRPELNIFQAPKGEACGHLKLRSRPNALTVESNRHFDFACDEGMSIPVNLNDMEIVQAPRWILVVEKYAVYQRLIQVKYGFNQGALIITGRGMPDRATRNLLAVLSAQIPAFALVDGDPCGFDIYLTYRIGSWQMSHEQSLVSPNLRLLGILPSQFDELRIPSESLLPLTNSDKSRLVSMRRKVEARASVEVSQVDSGINGDFNEGPSRELLKVLEELDMFAKTNRKAEIESVESCSNGVHRGKYLTHFYLNRFLEPLIHQKHSQTREHHRHHHRPAQLPTHEEADSFPEIVFESYRPNDNYEPNGHMIPENELYDFQSHPLSYIEPDYNNELSQSYNLHNEVIAHCSNENFYPPSPSPHFY